MNLTSSTFWISLLSLIAAAQGFFLSLVLVSRKRNSLANHILSVAIFLFSFELLTSFYHGSGLEQRFPQLIGITYPFPFLYSPVFLLYAQALTGSIRKLTLRHLWHFVPVSVVVAYMVPFYMMTGPEKLSVLSDPATSPWSRQLFVIDHVKFAYSFAYLVAILVVIHRHRRRVRERFSSLDKVNLDWLRILAYGGLLTWSVALGFYVFGFFADAARFDPIVGYADYVSLALAAYVYTIGYLGLRQPEIFHPDFATAGPQEIRTAYAKSGITEDVGSSIERRLMELMRLESPYRNPDLTLPELAQRLEVSPHNLSQVINSRLGINFYDFVNGYRVEEVKRRIADDDSGTRTLLSIGLDAGFNSKSSFNAVFKKTTGVTPSAFRQRILKSAVKD